jgi:hypothetical protein
MLRLCRSDRDDGCGGAAALSSRPYARLGLGIEARAQWFAGIFGGEGIVFLSET